MSPEDLQAQVTRSAAINRELREKIAQLERQVEEAKSAAALTCYQGGTAAGEVLAKMQAEIDRLTEENDKLRFRLVEHGFDVGAEEAAPHPLRAENTRLSSRLELVEPIARRLAEHVVAIGTGDGQALQAFLMRRGQWGAHVAAVDAADLLPPPASDSAASQQPAVGPVQDGGGADLPPSGIPLIDHDFQANTWPKRDECDKRVSDNPDGRPSRQCGRPRREHRG